MKLQYDNYQIINTIYTSKEISFNISKDISTGAYFFLRVFHNRKGDSRAQDEWFTSYDEYQMNVMNFNYLPKPCRVCQTDKNQAYTVFPYIPGKSLVEEKRLQLEQLEQLIEAVHHLHQKGFVHGSIEPANIWVTSEEKIILFGAVEWKAIHGNGSKATDIRQVIEIGTEWAQVNFTPSLHPITRVTELISTINLSNNPGLVEKDNNKPNIHEEVKIPDVSNQVTIPTPDEIQNKQKGKKRSVVFGGFSILFIIVFSIAAAYLIKEKPFASEPVKPKTESVSKKKNLTTKPSAASDAKLKMPAKVAENKSMSSEDTEKQVVPSYESARDSLKHRLMAVVGKYPLDRYDSLNIQEYSLTGGNYPELVCLYTGNDEYSEIHVYQYREMQHNYNFPLKETLLFKVRYWEFDQKAKELIVHGDQNKSIYKFINNRFEETYAVITWPEGDRYEGEMVNGERTGQGVYVWADGTKFEGEFKNGEATDNGKWTYP